MHGSHGTRGTATILGLAVALTIAGSIGEVRHTTDSSQRDDICFLIDGQIYCIPDAGGEAAAADARPGSPSRIGSPTTRSEETGSTMRSPEPGEPTAAGDGGAV